MIVLNCMNEYYGVCKMNINNRKCLQSNKVILLLDMFHQQTNYITNLLKLQFIKWHQHPNLLYGHDMVIGQSELSKVILFVDGIGKIDTNLAKIWTSHHYLGKAKASSKLASGIEKT